MGIFDFLKQTPRKRIMAPAPQGLSKQITETHTSKHVMKNAQRETYKFNVPEQELGMTDLIKDHKSGDRFLYGAVTSSQDEDEPSRLRRLIKTQPRLHRRPITIPKLPHLRLVDEVETFKLGSLFPDGSSRARVKGGQKMDEEKKYINITEVLVIYGSLISSDSAFSKVRVSIVDDRLLVNKIAKSYLANTNLISKATMSLSYCFPKDEIDAISLTFSRESAFLEEGRQWGVAQVQITMEEMEFPIQNSNLAVRAINALPQSTLEERDVDPDFVDISMMESNRRMLADMYMDGDLADETAPIVNRTEAVKYAKSSLAGPKGRKKQEVANVGGWEFMSQNRNAGVDAGINSREPSVEGSIGVDSDKGYRYGAVEEIPNSPTVRPATPPLKSSMKKTSFAPIEERRVMVTNPTPLSEFK